MTPLLIKILPLQFASILSSPVVFALTLLLFSRKKFVVGRVLAMLIGALIIAITLAVCGLSIGNNLNVGTHHLWLKAIIDFIIALIMLYFGISGFFKKSNDNKEKKEEHDQPRQLGKWLAIGFIVSLSNFDVVILNFTAAKEIGAASIQYFDKIILLIVGVLFFIAPILLPFIFYLALPAAAEKILTPINNFLIKFGHYLVAAILIIFGIYLFYRGIQIFY